MCDRMCMAWQCNGDSIRLASKRCSFDSRSIQCCVRTCWHWSQIEQCGASWKAVMVYSWEINMLFIHYYTTLLNYHSFKSVPFIIPFRIFPWLWWDPAWGRGTPFPPLLLPCPFTSSSFALYYLFPFFFSHPLYLFSSTIHPISFYQNSPIPFPGVRS